MNSRYFIPAFLGLMIASYQGYGQVDPDSELFITLREKDSILFNAAFNTCDTETMKSLFTQDFEFYHDKGGFTEGREQFLTPMKEGCDKRDPNAPQPSKRILQEDSLEVYPMYKNGELYGAIQLGIHRFEFLDEQKVYQMGDVAKFTHLWIRENNEWKIKRELSYDHQPGTK